MMVTPDSHVSASFQFTDRQVYSRYNPPNNLSFGEYRYYRGAFIASMRRKTPIHEVQIRKKLQVLWGDNPILANYFPVYVLGPFQ